MSNNSKKMNESEKKLEDKVIKVCEIIQERYYFYEQCRRYNLYTPNSEKLRDMIRDILINTKKDVKHFNEIEPTFIKKVDEYVQNYYDTTPDMVTFAKDSDDDADY